MRAFKFINPYNFVPVSNKTVERKSVKEETENQLYSGVIDYRLMTRTPLFIPNTSSEDAFHMREAEHDKEENGEIKKWKAKDHKSKDFFSYKDLSDVKESVQSQPPLPVIPGSEVRGMLRSNYEILTNSCFSAIDENTILEKRTSHVFKPGLLQKTADGYELYEAKDWLVRTVKQDCLEDADYTKADWEDSSTKKPWKIKSYRQSSITEGSLVSFVEDPDRSKGKGVKPIAKDVSLTIRSDKRKGYFLKGNDGPKIEKRNFKQEKHCGHIFSEKPGKKSEDRIAHFQDLSLLQKTLRCFEIKYIEYEEQLRSFIESSNPGECFPVYYDKPVAEQDYYMLSPASITHEVYETTMRKLLGLHMPCDKKDGLCPACALFGMLKSGDSAFAVSSRVRVSDLQYIQKGMLEDAYEKVVTLKPLSSPKLSNVEFYLKRPGSAWFWTYDYYIDEHGHPTAYSAEINGRKIYWHNMKCNLYEKNTSGAATELTEDNQAQTMTIRPLKKGQVFKGKLYFDSITKKELDCLIFLVNTGDPWKEFSSEKEYDKWLKEKKHGYKLGAGKPYGLGSIATAVTSVKLRNIYIDNESIKEQDMPYRDDYQGSSYDDAFEKMTRFSMVSDSAPGIPIMYPAKEKKEDAKVYEWFVENHPVYTSRKQTNQRVYEKGGMANNREQMAIQEYLVAMDPSLAQTEFDNVYGNGKTRIYSVNNGGKSEQQITELIGKVDGYNEKKTCAYLNCGNQRKPIFYKNVKFKKVSHGRIDEVLVLGDSIRIRYKGKEKGRDGKDYEQWEAVENIH